MPSLDHWAVVPAAGVGKRMGTKVAKQYLSLCGYPVIEHTLRRLLSHPRIKAVTVVVGPADEWWSSVPSGWRTNRADGGVERCHSVLNGLKSLLKAGASPVDRVLVHDAVRPCLRGGDIDALIEGVAEYEGGGLLGLPVRDTMKRVDAHIQVDETVPRDHLWHALTPQMFPLGVLHDVMEQAISAGVFVSDEAQAMELAGYRPKMIEGHPDNIKITRNNDLGLAALYLKGQVDRCE